MILKEMTLGAIQANCFILGCEKTKEAVVIDPGDDPKQILMSLANNQLTLKYIINTHGHFDHVGANKALQNSTNASILIHNLDEDLLKQSVSAAAAWGIEISGSSKADRLLNHGDTINFGQHKLKIIHTPGHTQGGISIYIKYIIKNKSNEAVFVGDTLFAGSIGRTDFPGGNLETLLSSIKNRLFTLKDEVVVYPGHMHKTTIGNEKASNPFCNFNS